MIFLYGTLMARDLLAAVAGGDLPVARRAVLTGWRRVPVQGAAVPMLRPDPDGQVEGIVVAGLDPAQVARIDLYETPFGYRPAEVEVETDTGRARARLYLPPEDQRPGAGDWSLADWRAGHERPAILAAREVFATEPRPDAAALARMWPMIEARAWSKHRAEQGARPAPARALHRISDGPPRGDFFRLQTLRLSHERFDGGDSGPLLREVFHGTDAAVLLPYDPRRDRVLLVEQFRVGAAARHDPAPWLLEPVAGIVDARETPEAAARREAREEAGVTLTALHRAGAFYPSPGSSTDHFTCFVGVCDIPQEAPFAGGLAEEHEDLRLHPMAFDEVLRAADAGELRTGPLLFLVNWLARHRGRPGLM